MPYTIAQYAQALANAIEDAPRDKIKTIARNMARILRQKKYTSKLPAILREAKRRYFYKNGIITIDIISAAPLSSAIKQEVRRIVGSSTPISESVRPGAIAGMSIIVDDTFRVDATAEGMIRNLFTKYEKHS